MSRTRRFALPFNALLLAALLVALMGAPAGATPPPAASPPGAPPAGLSAAAWSSIQAQMRQASYHFTRQTVDGQAAYRAPNLAHDLELSLGADGLRAARRAADGQPVWEFGLTLAAYGTQRLPVGGELAGQRERAEAQRGLGVTEWLVNGEAGAEHGLTLAAPPPGGAGTLAFDLRGLSLTPSLDAAGQSLRLRDAAGQTVLVYDQLAVYDVTQRRLAAGFELRGGQLLIHFDAAAVYPVVVDPLLYSQVKKLTASDGVTGDGLGVSVAVSGDTLVVGAPGKVSNTGAAYVFARNKNGTDAWGQVRKLTVSGGAINDVFGQSVAIDGDTLVVGAIGNGDLNTGAAYVFARNLGGADAWGQVTKLTAPGGANLDHFGISVAISGDMLVVGAHGKGTYTGAAYVFARNQGGADAWGQVRKLTALDAATFDNFGASVAIDGDTLVVGAPFDADQAGAAYVFDRNQGGADLWGQVAKLTASDGAAHDEFGDSVSLSGDTAVAGTRFNASSRGAAYVFARNKGPTGPEADAWGQVKKLTAADAAIDDQFGTSVALSGNTLVVGAPRKASNTGAAYVFAGDGVWREIAIPVASDGAANDDFGHSVALSGGTLVVGATGVVSQTGAAYVFARNQGGADVWGQVKKLTASDSAEFDAFGWSVTISGDTLVVGAPGETNFTGAAYVFARNLGGADAWGQVKKLTASDSATGDHFGNSVALSGDTLVVGAPLNASTMGAAYVFARNQGGADAWGQVKKLTASGGATGDHFGESVAISDDTAVAGAPQKASAAGAAYVFARNQGGADAWGQTAELTALGGAAGDYFGRSVALSGDTAVAGADGKASAAGAAYVFARNQGGADVWGQVANPVAPDGAAGDESGRSVALSVGTLAAGAHGDASDTGAAYVFERNLGPTGPEADAWREATKLTASDGAAGDEFGRSVTLGSSTLVAGAPGKASQTGAAYVFILEPAEVFLPVILRH